MKFRPELKKIDITDYDLIRTHDLTIVLERKVEESLETFRLVNTKTNQVFELGAGNVINQLRQILNFIKEENESTGTTK